MRLHIFHLHLKRIGSAVYTIHIHSCISELCTAQTVPCPDQAIIDATQQYARSRSGKGAITSGDGEMGLTGFGCKSV